MPEVFSPPSKLYPFDFLDKKGWQRLSTSRNVFRRELLHTSVEGTQAAECGVNSPSTPPPICPPKFPELDTASLRSLRSFSDFLIYNLTRIKLPAQSADFRYDGLEIF